MTGVARQGQRCGSTLRAAHVSRWWSAAGGAVAVLLVGSLFAQPSPPPYQSAAAGYRYSFPRDHGSHPSFRTEWWYYTGHLRTPSGRPFGYELTFFRRLMPPEDVKTLPSRWSVTQLYLAHFAVTDVSAQTFHFSEKVSREGLGKAGADETGLRVWVDDWKAETVDARAAIQRLSARDGHAAVSLTLEPAKPPVIHGTEGISRKGMAEGQASHYYSLTRLATTGTLRIGNDTFPVTGTSWMDHEFGSADLSPEVAGWDWFSLQLNDATELMLYRLRRSDGTSDPASSGTLINADGSARHLQLSDIEVIPSGSWTSPVSKASYPQRWHVRVPSLDLSLEVVPVMADQELRTARSTQVTYWEGAVTVSGSRLARPLHGHGYVELTGYAERLTRKL
jgi:predicted secreted hydrolase